MDNQTAILLLLIIAGIGILLSRAYKQRVDDAEAFYWATVNEPLVFISESAFDRTVELRHKDAVEKLKEYGNPFLRESDVWIYVYRVDIPIIGNVQQIQMRHCIWYDEILTVVAQRKAQWIEMKTGFIGGQARRAFAGQVNQN